MAATQPLAFVRRCAVTTSAVVLLAAGCGGGMGDANAKRLHELDTDPVFAKLPTGAALVSRVRTPATHRQPAFQSAGEDGPSVRLWFRGGTTTPDDVFRFVDRRARAAGWHPTAKGALGFTDRWAKTYPDGAAATLVLYWLRQQGFMLAAGVAPK
jgi:hypothetical protein